VTWNGRMLHHRRIAWQNLCCSQVPFGEGLGMLQGRRQIVLSLTAPTHGTIQVEAYTDR
jgi:hypothetical protein